MKNKKILLKSFTGFAIGTIPLAATISCSDDSTSLKAEDKDSAIMVVGLAGHKDKGFLEGAYNGVQEALKQKIGLKKYREIKIASSSDSDSEQGIKSALLAGGYNIIGVGYQYSSFLKKQVYSKKYKDRQFIVIDGSIDNIQKNLLAVSFKAWESSFLSGVAACLYLIKNKDTYDSDDLRIGAFGGGKFGSIQDMLSGFIQGIAYYNDVLALDSNSKIQFIGWGSSKGAGFTGTFVPNPIAVSIAKTLINTKKADIVFPVAGGQVASLVDVINEFKSNAKIIGVDSDQTMAFGKNGDGQKFITSSMKDTKTAVFEALKASYGKTASVEFGTNNKVGLDRGFVKIAKGLINSDDFKGKEFKSILKNDQTSIDTTDSAETIYKQLSNSKNKVFQEAKLTQRSSTNWEKISVIWEKPNNYIPTLSDVKVSEQ